MAALAPQLAATTATVPAPWPPSGDFTPAADCDTVLYLFSPAADRFRRYEDLARRIAGASSSAHIGLVTGIDTGDVEASVRSFAQARSPATGRPWILAGGPQLVGLSAGADKVDADGLCEARLATIGARDAPYGIAVGHGREDILYFGKSALCGQRADLTGPRPCEPAACSYPQRKAPVDVLGARILALVSCNAGRIGEGLLPPQCRLALSSLRRAIAIIAPVRLFTLSDGLVDHIAALLDAGACAGEVARSANALQEERFGERGVFAVFGDPHAATPSAGDRARTGARSPADGVARLRRAVAIAEGAAVLATLGVDREHLAPVLAAAEVVERSVLAAGGRTTPQIGERAALLERAWRAAHGLAVLDLRDRAQASYVWLSNRYRLLCSAEDPADCPLCGARAHQALLGNPARPHEARRRLTCVRCGILWDRPEGPGRFVFTAVAVHRHAPDRIIIDATLRLSLSDTTGSVAVTLNNGGPMVEDVRLRAGAEHGDGHGDGEKRASGLEIPLGDELQVRLACRDLRNGTYFLKAFLACDDGLFEASAPVVLTDQGGRHARRQQ